MKSVILTGTLALAAGAFALMAQQNKQGQAAPPQQQQPQQMMVPGAKSPGESQAIIALFQAQQQNNPDMVIKNAEELITKYSDTAFKEQALLAEGDAYRMKGDLDKSQIFDEQALQVNPKSYQAMLGVGEALAQKTRENDLDKEEKLSKADKNLNGAIDLLKTAPKPNPQLPDAQWEEAKKYLTARGYNGLGMVALVRKKYDDAATDFKTAADLDPQDPTYMVRLASAYQSAGKNAEAVAACDKVLAEPNLNPRVKQVAESIKNAATQAQGKK